MRPKALSRRGLLAGALGAALAGKAARAEKGGSAPPVVVGSKIDLEGALLGRLILLALAKAGVPTEDRLQIGPTAITRSALISGAIDLCVEYTGNAAMFFHEEGDPVWKNAKAGYARAAALDLKFNNLVWLVPAPADNSWAIAVPNRLARAAKLRGLEDFARFVQDGNRVRLAASAEFVESPAGLPAFEAVYGFKLDAAQLLVLSGGETSATMKAAASGMSGVNAAMAYAADGALKALDLLALDDTRRAQPIYAPAPVARAAALELYPQIRPALEPVFARLDLAALRALNEKVVIEGRDPAAIGGAFLAGAFP